MGLGKRDAILAIATVKGPTKVSEIWLAPLTSSLPSSLRIGFSLTGYPSFLVTGFKAYPVPTPSKALRSTS
jgi:hypothetical protein